MLVYEEVSLMSAGKEYLVNSPAMAKAVSVK